MRTTLPSWLGAAAALCLPALALAQPGNDTCGSATTISTLPFDSGDINAFTATDDTGVTENPSCDSTTNTAGANNGVWFFYMPASTTSLILTETDSLDTATSIWTGTCGALTQVACSDPETSTFTFTGGTGYYILVSRWSATNPVAGNTYQFTLAAGGTCCDPATGLCTFIASTACAASSVFSPGGTCTPNPCTQPAVPANDTCASAISLTLDVPVSGNNASATSTNDGPAPSCQTSSGKGVWYTFVSGGGNFQVSSCGSPQDTVLTVFTTPDCASFTQISGGCDDDTCDGVSPVGSAAAALITSVSLPAGTYYIRLSSFGSAPAGNNFTLVVRQPGSCCIASCCTVIGQAQCTGTFTPGGTCAAGACGTTAGDNCASPLTAVLGANSGANCGANTSVVITPFAQCGALSGAGGAKDIFYTFTAPVTAMYTFDTCAAVGFDTVLAVYSACPVDGSTAPLACNDDATTTNCPVSGVRSQIQSLSLTGGTSYIIRVAAYGATTPAEGAFVLNITQIGGGGSGACCSGSTCSVVDSAGCTGSNTRFVGAGSACNAAGNNTTPCCRADFNQSGGVSVQDIFDFLVAYFANDATADFNQVGGVSVQDIFDFLGAYFSGCA